MSLRTDRSLAELVDTREPGMDLVREWIGEARNPVELLPMGEGEGARTLVALQVTTRSPMGAIAYETGGLLIDHGWIRVLGARGPRSARDLATWNGLLPPGSTHRLAGAFLVADDVIGGFFALDGGAFGSGAHDVFYMAPDTLEWEETGRGCSDWLRWALLDDLDDWYGPLRWSGWEQDVAVLQADQAFSIFPPVWVRPDRGGRDRRAVPVGDLWWFQHELARGWKPDE